MKAIINFLIGWYKQDQCLSAKRDGECTWFCTHRKGHFGRHSWEAGE